jgi:thiamine pyrophosphate-dependent acetolactate synthase large subunit-like protein
MKGGIFMELSDIINSDMDNDEKLKEIENFIDQNYIEKGASDEGKNQIEQKYLSEIQKLKDDYENEKKQSVIDGEIQKQGGKNVKAIKALIEEGDIFTDENGNLCVDLSRIMKSDPYLFTEKKENLVGTGVTKNNLHSKKSFLDYARKGAGLK